MGLTIHYSLRSTCRSDAAARHHVERLRDRAMDLPFQQVGGLIDLSGEDCDFERLDREYPHRWLLVQANEHVTHGERGYSVPPKRLIAFETSPGEGCEPANFGLCRYPSTVVGRDGRSIRTGLTGWRWRSFCKTQYASNLPRAGCRTSSAATSRSCGCSTTPVSLASSKTCRTRAGTGTSGT